MPFVDSSIYLNSQQLRRRAEHLRTFLPGGPEGPVRTRMLKIIEDLSSRAEKLEASGCQGCFYGYEARAGCSPHCDACSERRVR